jgi:hypothetical protein
MTMPVRSLKEILGWSANFKRTAIFAVQLSLDVFREPAIASNSNDREQWVLIAGENCAQLLERLRVENALCDGIAVHKFSFPDNPVEPIVTTVAILAETQSLPRNPVQCE